MMENIIYLGDIVHTKSLNELEIYPNGFVAVDLNGKIIGIGENYEIWRQDHAEFVAQAKNVHLKKHQFLMPGFIDCHIHAPQVAQIGLGLDMPLLDWLNTYTFPLEAKFKNEKFASKVYTQVVKSTINCGTTLASYFGTNDYKSNLILAQQVKNQGQRALIGKVCSNCNSPDYYCEDTAQSSADTLEYIKQIKALNSDLVHATITPRFALSCSTELLKNLGDIAHKHNLHIQSHISENLAEIEFVRKIFGTSYAAAYDNARLLTKKTVLAHAVHLELDEITLLRERGTSVAHCPASNTNLSSGFCDVMRLLKNGLKVGLGTDVSGGHSLSLKDSLLRAMEISHHLEFVKKHDIKGSGKITNNIEDYTPLNYKQALYLATLGGAEALAMHHVTGNFVVGKDWDALLIDTNITPLCDFNQFAEEEVNETKRNVTQKLLENLQRYLYVGDDRNILQVFVKGRQIK